MKAHRTDSVSLFFGVAFLLVALGFLARSYLDVRLPAMGWFVAGGLIFFGLVTAVGALVPKRAKEAAEEPATEATTEAAGEAKATEDQSPDRPMLAE